MHMLNAMAINEIGAMIIKGL